MKTWHCIFTLFFLLVFYSVNLFSQTSITGTVSDSQLNTGIECANVLLEGTNYGTVTNSAGEFELLNIPNGSYTLLISHVGYNTYVKRIKADGGNMPVNTSLTKSDVNLDEVTVTAAQLNERPEKTAQPVTIINIKEIARRKSYNIGDLLDDIPGIRIIKTAGAGRANGISMRSLNGGPSSTKTLILVDGRPLNNGWQGGADWNTVPTEGIEKVEVVKGPASALYGSQATAGVINVITKSAAPGWHGKLSIGYEFNAGEKIDNKDAEGYGRPEIGAANIALNTSYKQNKTGHFISFGYRNAGESFPTSNENDWRNFDLKYKMDHNFSESFSTCFQADLHNDDWKNEAARTPYEDKTKYYGADLSANYKTSSGILKSRIYLNYTENKNEIISNNIKTGFETYRLGTIIDYTLPVTGINAILKFGVDAFYDNADVNDELAMFNLKFNGIDKINVYNKRSGEYSLKDVDTYSAVYGSTNQSYDRSDVALFVQYQQMISQDLNVVAGMRLDKYSTQDAVITPKLGLNYELFSANEFVTTIKANYGTGFKAPTLRGLYSKSLSGYGNINLKPEKTTNYDVGIYQRFAGLGYIEVSFFKMDVEELSINDKAGSNGNGNYVLIPNANGAVDTLSFNVRKNLGGYSPSGVEVGFKFAPVSQLTFSGSYSYLDPEDFTFQTSQHRFNVNVAAFIPLGKNRLEGEVRFNYTGDGYFFDYQKRPFDSYSLLSARISFDLADYFRVSLHGNNLTDKNYKLWHYAWMPGRSFTLQFETGF